MAKTKIILTQDVPKLGKEGDVVEVAGGYARNYLIPRGLALPATEGNLKHFESMKRARMRKMEREKISAERIAASIAELVLTIEAKAGEAGKLYGSITGSDIAEALFKKGIKVDHHQVIIEEPIKSTGSYTVKIKLHPEVSADLKVEVVPLQD